MANIHTIRASQLNLKKFLNKKIEPSNNEDVYEENYLSEIESTGWLNHLRAILSSSVKLAKIVVSQKQAVVVHCSDGWDRTALVVSLGQLLVDGKFRTSEGFRTLIYKEWIRMGRRIRIKQMVVVVVVNAVFCRTSI